MRRLIAGCVAAGLVYVPLAVYVDSDVSPTTPAMALLAGGTFGALALTMVSSTRGWSLRAVGLFLMLAGAAVLLIGIGIDILRPIADRPEEAARDAVLALWAVGIPLALVGVVAYVMGGDRPETDGE